MNPCGQDGGQEEVTIVAVDTVTMNEDIAGKYYGCANGMIAVLNVWHEIEICIISYKNLFSCVNYL